MRIASREMVFKLVFEYTFYGVANEGTLELFLTDAALGDDDKQYIKDAYAGIVEHEEEFKEFIASHLTGYTVDRIYRPDYAVLLVAVYELKNKIAAVPVIINAAVELSKKYGTDKSGAFVNGVLAKVAKDIN